jgi:TrmH family RNA methyltransferase
MTNGHHDDTGADRQVDWRGSAERVRRTLTARGRTQSGYFSIEGIRLHERALRAGKQVETAVLSESLAASRSPRVQALLADLQSAGSRLVVVPDNVVAELTEGRDLGAILGLVALPASPSLPAIVSAQPARPPLLLVAADIKEPGNTGALVRTALAGGATAFIASGISDPYHPKAVRTSMGSLFKLPVITAGDTRQLLQELSELGVARAGLAVDGELLLPQVTFADGGVALIVGSEAWGLAPESRALVDYLVSIPMREGVDSYSVNAAAAIALYEFGRRRPV